MLAVSVEAPLHTTDLLAYLPGGTLVHAFQPTLPSGLTTVVTTVLVKRTVAGRRFEAVGASGRAAWATGLRVQRHRAGGYVAAQVHYWLGGLLLAGILNKPTAYQGDRYLLPTVAAVVLGGTSLLGGPGNIVATALAALFLTQLDQFVLAIGVNYAVETLVQSIAFAVGVALYTIDWRRLRARFGRPPRPAVSPG